MNESDKNQPISEAERRFFADEPALDPYDLSALKPKRKPLRVALALAVLAACSYLLFDSRAELSFFFQRTPIALGSLEDNDTLSKFYNREMPSNAYVTFSGVPNYPPFLWQTAGGLGRGPGPNEHARLLVFPPQEGKGEIKQGGIDHIGQTVKLSYSPLAVIYYADDSTPREHLKGEFEGRLVKLEDAPFLGPIRRFLWKNYSIDVPENAYIMLDGELPSSAWVYALFAFLALIAIVYNLFVLVKQFSVKTPSR
jgi:hypothetical protein